MSKFSVTGGNALQGRVRVSGAKNAVLPIIAATLLTDEIVEIADCPNLSDVNNMLAIMEMIGCTYQFENHTIRIDPSNANKWEMPEELGKELRSSIFMLGPVLGRFKRACFTYPGGCEIGLRPINLHIQGLRKLNIDVREEHGYILCNGENMRAADIHLDYPSVGATENLMMTAVAIKGCTVIQNAAREPEIEDLQNMLNAMGARVFGAGTSTVVVHGGYCLHGVRHTLLSDRIIAGTMMTAAAITGGDVLVENLRFNHLQSIIAKLKESGCELRLEKQKGSGAMQGSEKQDTGESIRVIGRDRPNEMHLIETFPHPGFPTDMQAQFFALACVAKGTSVIIENVFENRFKHAPELNRMGAICTIKDRTAIIRGIPNLAGAQVSARDLRGGAALVLAGLRAEGQTVVNGVEYIDRGYECLENTLTSLGAEIKRHENQKVQPFLTGTPE